MTLVQWLGEKLGYLRRHDSSQEAIEMTDEVTNQARSIREQLKPFAGDDDPFSSIISKKTIAVEYENVVEFDRTPRAQ